jgi:rubrerythrin
MKKNKWEALKINEDEIRNEYSYPALDITYKCTLCSHTFHNNNKMPKCPLCKGNTYTIHNFKVRKYQM